MSVKEISFTTSREAIQFSGIRHVVSENSNFKLTIIDGLENGLVRGYFEKDYQVYAKYSDDVNGYSLTFNEKGTIFTCYDMGFLLELFSWDSKGRIVYQEGIWSEIKNATIDELLADSSFLLDRIYELEKDGFGNELIDVLPVLFANEDDKKRARAVLWAYLKGKKEMGNQYQENTDLLPFFKQQEKIRSQVVRHGFSSDFQLIAGADVAYNELEQRMVGAIVVLDAETLEILDQAVHEMDITFPYVPGLFSFREVPPLKEAYKKLKVKPDLIVCDGHGIAHPKGAGMASHLGVELGVPTIGCAKSRLVGGYDQVEKKRGSFSSLMLGDQEIGRVLRTRSGVKPMFVSVGHLVSLDTACGWVLKLCPQYRQPETTRKADALVRTVMKERTEVEYPEE